MFYVCQSCGKYNLSRHICTSRDCDCTNLKSACFSGDLANASTIVSTHKLFTSQLYHYICDNPNFKVAAALLGSSTSESLSMISEVQARFRHQDWTGIDDDIDKARCIFPTAGVQEQMRRQAEIEAHTLRQRQLVEQAKQEIPAWVLALQGKTLCLSYAADFNNVGYVIEFKLKSITAEKKTLVFDCRTIKQDMFGQQVGSYYDSKTCSIKWESYNAADTLSFALLSKYAKQFANVNWLTFSCF